MGTPAELKVPRVRAKRARATLWTTLPILSGILSEIRPQTFLPCSILFYRRKRKALAHIAAYTSTSKLLIRMSEMPIASRVGSGRAPPRCSNNLAKIGTIKMSINQAARIARTRTTMG